MKRYLPLVAPLLVLVAIFGTIYAVSWQALRADANWPQIQEAQDGATLLDKNQPPRMFSGTYVDISKSLASFTNVYNKDGTEVTGSGYLRGSLANVPKGMLQAADNKEFSSVTWSPEKGIRIAAVVVAADNYYVVSGRSLVEVEKNMSKTFVYSFVGGLIALAVVTTYFAARYPHHVKALISKKKKAPDLSTEA